VPMTASPTCNDAYAERWVRTVRAECLDWTLVWSQRQLHRVLTEYLRVFRCLRHHDRHRACNVGPIRGLKTAESANWHP
jgi:hypothetical protein